MPQAWAPVRRAARPGGMQARCRWGQGRWCYGRTARQQWGVRRVRARHRRGGGRSPEQQAATAAVTPARVAPAPAVRSPRTRPDTPRTAPSPSSDEGGPRHRRPRRAGTDPGGLDLPRDINLTGDQATALRWLESPWQRKEVRDALSVASPGRCRRPEEILAGEWTEPRRIQRAVVSLASYSNAPLTRRGGPVPTALEGTSTPTRLGQLRDRLAQRYPAATGEQLRVARETLSSSHARLTL